MIEFYTLLGEQVFIDDIREQEAFMIAVSDIHGGKSFFVDGWRYFARDVARCREIKKNDSENTDDIVFGERGKPFENKTGRPHKILDK